MWWRFAEYIRDKGERERRRRRREAARGGINTLSFSLVAYNGLPRTRALLAPPRDVSAEREENFGGGFRSRWRLLLGGNAVARRSRAAARDFSGAQSSFRVTLATVARTGFVYVRRVGEGTDLCGAFHLGN